MCRRLVHQVHRLHSRSYRLQNQLMTTEATPQDWEDFWYAPEKFGSWYPEDFEPTGNKYVDQVLGLVDYPPAFKRDSRLSE